MLKSGLKKSFIDRISDISYKLVSFVVGVRMRNEKISKDIVSKMKKRVTRGVVALIGFASLLTATKLSRDDFDGIAMVWALIGSMSAIAVVEYLSLKKIVIEGLRK